MLPQISESELTLMKIIWQNGGSALFSCITDELEKENCLWKKNTALTLLSRLIEKKYLKIRKIGRRNEYIALITEQEYQTAQTHSFLNRGYSGNVKNLVSTLLRQDILSEDEMAEVERYWAGLGESVEADAASSRVSTPLSPLASIDGTTADKLPDAPKKESANE